MSETSATVWGTGGDRGGRTAKAQWEGAHCCYIRTEETSLARKQTGADDEISKASDGEPMKRLSEETSVA